MHKIGKAVILPAMLALATFSFGPCSTDPKDPEQSLESFEWYRGGPTSPAANAKTALLDVIGAADKELIVVFSSLTDTDVTNAIVAAKNRGVNVYAAMDKTAADGTSATSKSSLENASITVFTNKRVISPQYDATNDDGKVESNFVVADSFHCFNSTHGADTNVYTGASVYSLSMKFKSRNICSDFQREGVQLTLGGLFSDEGLASFGDMQYNKKVSDPNTVFTLGPYRFYIYFGAQERPINPIITNLMNSKKSIRFAAQSLTQDMIINATNNTKNRSHILDTFRYKMRANDLFGAKFTISGAIGRDSNLTEGTVDSTSYYFSDGAKTTLAQTLDTSLHGLIVADNALDPVSLKKYNGASNEGLGFNLFLIDESRDNPMAIIASDDLRRRYKNDEGNDLYFNRIYADYYNISDSVVIMVEKTGTESGEEFFADMAEFITAIQNDTNGVTLQ